MTLEDVEAKLATALTLRVPVFEDGTSGRAKAAALEDYMLLSAYSAGDLIEARHWLRGYEAELSDCWEGLAGWEIALVGPRRAPSKAAIQTAKIKTSPKMYAEGRSAMRLRASLDDQITRFEREEKVVSRAYTMISGS